MPEIPRVLESDGLDDTDFQTADAGGDTFLNTPDTVLWIKNTSGSDREVTAQAANLCRDGFLDDQVIPCAAGKVTKTQAFPHRRFNAISTVSLTYDDATGLSLVAVQQEKYTA